MQLFKQESVFFFHINQRQNNNLKVIFFAIVVDIFVNFFFAILITSHAHARTQTRDKQNTFFVRKALCMDFKPNNICSSIIAGRE